MSLKIVVACALMFIVLSIATAQQVESSADGSFLDVRTGSVAVPLSALKKPAADLVDLSGQKIETVEAVKRAKKGEDLSRYNPVESKIWQNKVYPVLERPLTDYPNGETGVRFLSVEADGNPYTGFYRVQSLDGSGRTWRLGLSLISQSTTMRSVMLRKLGYDVVTAKPYSKLKLVFPTLEKKKDFIESLELKDMNLESRGWMSENKEDSLSLILTDAVLETQRNESIDWHWGFIPNPNAATQEERMQNLAWVEYFSKFRAYRALMIPFTLLFVPESPNRYNPKIGSIVNDHVILYHPLASGFASLTREDTKWILNRMNSWTEKDYREIVNLAHYPESIKELIYRILVMRVKNLYRLFAMPVPAGLPRVDLNYTSPDGLVVKGKVVREKVEGYPQRFTHGDRQSPFKDEDWWRYAGIRARTSLITTALSKLNEKLQLIKMDAAAQKYQESISNQIRDHFRKNPFAPMEKPVQRWGGPLMGFNVQAGRHVTTGTYYGSTAAVQLVDIVSASMNLGYFENFEKFPLLGFTSDGRATLLRQPVTTLAANMSLRRDYIHVRPLFSMDEADKISWKHLVVPYRMASLAKTIDSKDMKDFRTFVQDLKEGEVFTITDSIEVGIMGRLTSAIDSLIAIEPLSFINSIGVGADASRLVLRQTQIIKGRNDLQIYVRDQTSRSKGLNMDVNYFINLMSLRAQGLQAEVKSDAFIIDYRPDWDEEDLKPEQKSIKEDQEKNLRSAVVSLLRGHGTEQLYTHFRYQKMEIEHILNTHETKAKVLAMNMINTVEDHEVKLRPPASEEDPDRDPKEDEITLFRRRRGELKGMDLLGWATSFVEAVLNHKSKRINWDLAQPADSNPANLPFGKAYWRQVITEKDLSGRVSDVAIVQHIWGGWHMGRAQFMKLIDEVVEQLGLPSDAKYDLIEKDTFHNTDGIDFYRVTANLSIRKSGIEKIRDLVVQPGLGSQPAEKAKFLGRLFQVISEKIGGVKARQADRLMLEDVMKILGNGNLELGRQQYSVLCQYYINNRNAEGVDRGTGAWINGSYFDCLTPWAEQLMKLSARYPKGNSINAQKDQVRWATEVLYILEAQIPMPQLLTYLGEENVLYLVQVNGFRSGDEDGDLSFISNTWGKPVDDFEEASGVFQFYARKTGIISTEIDRSMGSFR